MSNSSLDNGDTSYSTCWDLIIIGVTPQPDNDISGIGITVSFVASAYITFLLVVLAYLLGYVDQSLLRPVDTLVHRRQGLSGDHQASRVVMIRQTVLSFSDQQIVTGIAILIAGFARFTTAMNVYHFQMVIYLAWMSSSTHLSALTMLQVFLRERRMLLMWRIAGMLLLFVFLLVALIPTWANLWAVDVTIGDETTGWGVPAQCFWLRTYDWGVNPDAPIGYLILISSYVWKVGSIFRSSRTFFHRWVRGPTECFLESWLRREAKKMKQTGKTWRFKAAMIVYALVIANFEFCSSFAASLWLSFGGLLWGTVQVMVPRIQNDWWAWQENAWGFGQVTPLVLLIQPLGSVLEHIRNRNRRDVANDASNISDVELESHVSRTSWLRSRSTFRSHPQSNVEAIKRSRRNSLPATKSMSEVLASLEIRAPEDRSVGDLPGHQRMMYNTICFKGLFWVIQACALAAIGTICGLDGWMIGWDSSINWLFMIGSGSGGLVFSVIWLMFCMRSSRLFK